MILPENSSDKLIDKTVRKPCQILYKNPLKLLPKTQNCK